MESSTTYAADKNSVQSVTDAAGNTTNYTVDATYGLLLQTTDAKGNIKAYAYNGYNNRPLKVRDRNSSGTNLAEIIYTFTDGQLSTLSRNSNPTGTAKTQTYSFAYNPWGQNTSITVGNIPIATYEYENIGSATNGGGNLATMTYGNGDSVSYTYDEFDRLIKTVYNDTGKYVEYAYNAEGALAEMYYKNSSDTVISAYAFEYDSLGRLIRSAERDSSGLVQRTEHIYDSVGRLASQSWVLGSSNYSETYSYNDGENANGSLSKMTTATGDSLHYSYDALHRLQKVTTKNANGTALFSTAYAFKANGTKTTPLVEYRNVRIGTSGTILEGKKYEYDALGNITAIYESTGSYRKLVAYTYDEQNQLLSETYYSYSGTSTTPATTNVYSYTYDTVGNILTESKNGTVTKDYTYSTGDWKDLLTEFGEGKIAYEGQTYTKSTNTVSGTPTSGNPVHYDNGNYVYYMEWSHGRQLSYMGVSSSTEQFQTAYNYDADGIRTQKFVENDVHNYITQNGKVVRETIGSGTSAKVLSFIYDEAGKPFALKYSTNGGSSFTTYYYVLNLQGDVIKLVNASGTAVATYTYNAWGEILTATGTMADVNPLRYRGYYYDTETGFYYVSSRYYDPEIGRWINADGYVSTGQDIIGYNMFAYCGNNPVIREDSTGQFWINTSTVTADVTVCMADILGCAPKPYSGNANCYAYAMKLENDPRTGLPFTRKPQPGEFSGNGLTNKDLKGSFEKVKKVINKKVSADAKVLNLNYTEVYSADHIPKAGNWVVALAYATDGSDYHWWRRNDDGTWSHKPGDAPIINWDESGNPITDPKNCDRGIYDGFLGYYEVGPN